MTATVAALLLPASAGAVSLPRSIAALGDSLTAGQGAGGTSGSWSSGTNSAVNSHYLRLAAQTSGVKRDNYAQPGKKVSVLAAQAQMAVDADAEYVTILIGTNDVCGSLTSLNTFRTQFTDAMTKLDGLPAGATVFVASIPNWAHLYDVFSDDDKVKAKWKDAGRCPNFLVDPSPAAAERLTQFNAALSEICGARAPRCVFDGNAVYNHAFKATDYSTSDYFHFSTTGQAALSALTYPIAFPGGGGPPPPPPPPPTGTPCDLGGSFSGSLAGPGSESFVPTGQPYVTTVKAQHLGCLRGPAGTNFDLYLQRLSSGEWKTAAKSIGKTSTEDVKHKGKPGTYRWQIVSRTGGGPFTLSFAHPA